VFSFLPSFISSTSSCSLSSWFTSSCTCHLITVPHLSLPRPINPDLKLIRFTNPLLQNVVFLVPFGLSLRILELDLTKWTLAFASLSSLYIFCLCLRVLQLTIPSAFQSTLNSLYHVCLSIRLCK